MVSTSQETVQRENISNDNYYLDSLEGRELDRSWRCSLFSTAKSSLMHHPSFLDEAIGGSERNGKEMCNSYVKLCPSFHLEKQTEESLKQYKLFKHSKLQLHHLLNIDNPCLKGIPRG